MKDNKIVGLGYPELGMLADICDFKCKYTDECNHSCYVMTSLIERIFELQRLAGFEEIEE